MQPLGMRLPAINRVMLIIFILGIVGITFIVPSFRGPSPAANESGNLSLPIPWALSRNTSPVPRGTPGPVTDTVTPAPGQDIAPATTPSPVATSVALPRANLTTPARNVTPFVASLAALNPGPVSMPADLNPVGYRFEYRDNNRKQVVSVSVNDYDSGTEYSYHFRDLTVPDIITVKAKPGYRFFFIGVTCDLTGIVGEGKRTTFMTPAVSSFKLMNRGVTYQPVDPGSIKDILQDAIINVGTLAREESIDKDNPLKGVLIYEVPLVVTPRDSYIEFCPTNTRGLNQPHSPTWDCEKEAVRWKLFR